VAAPGRKPKPVALKVLEGNPGKRPLNHDEPKPTPIAPACPDWLAPLARAEWDRVAPELERLGLLTAVDGAVLGAYCQAYARMVQAEEAIERLGFNQFSKDGYAQQRPEVAIAMKSAAMVKAFAAEFGLTPSSRGRMTLPPQDPGDDDFD
jgi:P27 family predicted phage terminase small subunit